MNYNETREKFISLIIGLGKTEITKTEIIDVCRENKMAVPQWFVNDPENRISRGLYKVPASVMDMAKQQAQVIPLKNDHEHNRISSVSTDIELDDLVPKVYKNYVPFGNFNDILEIVKSNRFFPVFISGHSGNGKTMSIEQACAKAKRKFICVSMTPDTDESDLLGNFVLIDGQMVWRDGPVTTAARQGAVLCIDEIDYGAQNLSSLQRVLEGKPFMLKKKGELVTPSEGFTVFATANTKGKGSDDGRYMFTNVLNEAFLERFRNTIEQGWAPVNTEKKIIKKELSSVGCDDDNFAEKLVLWADVIRKTFDDGGCDEVISTRRLVHIVETYGIFKDKIKAITLCLNRFDDDTKASFLDLYTKVDDGSHKEEESKKESETDPNKVEEF
jgi:midasin (ATPase involved in ribosome maturation)